ncbi:hypothetical protein DFH06DRAFT_1474728 [Mycena polygramma]|nr:hypothetical protein DFH06DRAFT_1474728 [Mycena polygramma]
MPVDVRPQTPSFPYAYPSITIRREAPAADQWRSRSGAAINGEGRIEMAIPTWLDGPTVDVHLPHTVNREITFNARGNPPTAQIRLDSATGIGSFDIAVGGGIFADRVWQLKETPDLNTVFDVIGVDAEEMTVTWPEDLEGYHLDVVLCTWVDFALILIVWRCLRDYPAIEVTWTSQEIALRNKGERISVGSKNLLPVSSWARWSQERTLRVSILGLHVFEFSQLGSGIQVKSGRNTFAPFHSPEIRSSDETAGWIQLHGTFALREDPPAVETKNGTRSVMLDTKCIVWRSAEGNPDDKVFWHVKEKGRFDLLKNEDKAYMLGSDCAFTEVHAAFGIAAPERGALVALLRLAAGTRTLLYVLCAIAGLPQTARVVNWVARPADPSAPSAYAFEALQGESGAAEDIAAHDRRSFSRSVCAEEAVPPRSAGISFSSRLFTSTIPAPYLFIDFDICPAASVSLFDAVLFIAWYEHIYTFISPYIYRSVVHSCEGVTWARRKAPNLYVVIHQGGQVVQQTNVIKRDLTPKWDFLCNLSLDSPIALRLWHDSLLRCRDICLGVAHTDIASLLDLPSSDTEFIRLRLISEDRQSNGTPTGTVLVRLMGQREAVSTALANAQQDLAKLTLGSALTEATEMIDNPPLVTETFEAGLSMIIAKLDVLVHLGDEIHPYANMAWKILTSVYQAVKREQATEDKLHKLVDTIVAVYSFTEETDMLAKSVKNLEDKYLAIVKQTVECALFIREYSGHGFTARAIRNTGDNIDSMIDSLSETLLKLRDSLESSMNVQGVFLSTQVLQKVDRLVQSDALKTLDPVPMNAGSRPTCLQGTRVQLLDEISDWLMAPEKTSSVLWVSGVAGSGKSTIATTISVSFHELQRLGAFMFFDRNNTQHSRPDSVIRTLAHLLARSNPHIASAIHAVLERDAAVVDTPLQTQFETLLLKPLWDVEHLIQGPILIVIDALDECGDPASRKNLLSSA